MRSGSPEPGAAARYAIVRADPLAQKADVIRLFAENFRVSMDESRARFRKYYEANPCGPPALFLAQHAESARFVGMAALFPTRLRVSGEAVPAAVPGDFVVDAPHRGFGPALQLLQASLGALEAHAMTCAFSMPGPPSQALALRVGYTDLGQLTRFVKVLRLGRVVQRYARRAPLGRLATGFASLAVDPVFSCLSRERLHRRPATLSVERPAAFDDRFVAVWEATWRQHRIAVDRDPTLQNWRYEKTGPGDVTDIYTILALVSGSREVAGYAVYKMDGETCEVMDLAFLPVRAVVDTLLSELIREARRRAASAVYVRYLGPTSLLTRRLRAFGFLARKDDAGPLHVFPGATTPFRSELLLRDSWHFLFGDTDI